MKLVIGLGNPDKKYELTRHNVGFIVIDSYVNDSNWKEFHNSLIFEKKINDEKIIFVKPQTYMNNSGEAVRLLIDYYKLTPDDIFVIQDDISLELGKHRIKYDSSDGGHNGIKSIINNLNTQKFLRLKVGLAKEKEVDTISYVLGKLTKKEINQIDNDLPTYFSYIDAFISGGKEKVLMM